MTEILSPQFFGKIACALAEQCGGCGWITYEYSAQHRAKCEALQAHWLAVGLPPLPKELSIRPIAASELRDRVDLVLSQGKLGFYDAGKQNLLDVKTCPQLSAELESWYQDFRKNLPQVEKGSLRLRVSPSGKRGMWLDFANLDIKRLLDEAAWLDSHLAAGAVVEMGQKRKRVGWVEGKLKFLDPELEHWHSTFVKGSERPLYHCVGGFSQPGAKTNRVLVEELEKRIPARGAHWLELGAGNGNFTLPLLAQVEKVTVIESDRLALAGLERALSDSERARIALAPGSFQDASPAWDAILSTCEGVVADPPRSGLGRFPIALARIGGALPRHFIYVSCYGESLARDAAELFKLGFQLQNIVGIDQFPQTPHCEWIAHFERL